MRMSSPPLVGMTFTSSSPSRRLMAMMPVRSEESYSLNFVFLTWPVLGGEEEEAVRLVVARVDDRLDVLAGLQLQQVRHRRAAGGALLLRDLVRLEAVDAPEVREEQQVGVGGGGEDVADVVLVAQLGPGHAAAAAALGPERVGGDRLDVALGRQRDDELLVVDEVLDVHVADVEGDLGAPLVGELLLDLGQLVLDDGAQHAPRRRGSPRASAIVSRSAASSVSRSILASRVSWPSCRSRMCSACTSENSNGAAVSPARAAARSSEARMRAMTSSMTSTALSRPSTMWARSCAFCEAELGPAPDDVDLVVDVGLQRLHEVERAGDAVDERDRVHGEVRLQRRVLVEVVEDDEAGRVLLELDDEARLAPGRLVVDVADALDRRASAPARRCGPR